MAEEKLQIHLYDGAQTAEEVIALEGVLNAETAFRFGDVAREHKPAALVIDMSGVRYVDSSGLGVLIGIYASCEREGRKMLLAGMNDRVWELFRVCKIEDVFTRYSTVADAEHVLAASAAGATTA